MGEYRRGLPALQSLSPLMVEPEQEPGDEAQLSAGKRDQQTQTDRLAEQQSRCQTPPKGESQITGECKPQPHRPKGSHRSESSESPSAAVVLAPQAESKMIRPLGRGLRLARASLRMQHQNSGRQQTQNHNAQHANGRPKNPFPFLPPMLHSLLWRFACIAGFPVRPRQRNRAWSMGRGSPHARILTQTPWRAENCAWSPA